METIFVVLLICGVLLALGRTRSKTTTHARRNSHPVSTRSPTRARVKKQSAAPSQNQILPTIPPNRRLIGRAYVIDGDTIKIKGIKIRLAGIDAPEVNMPWGQKSKWAMVDICKGQTITVELDGERSYDRLVGTCFLPDGSDLGAEIIQRGLALDLPFFSGGKYRHLEPEGARKKLCNGKFGHASIRITQRTEIRIRSS